MTGRAPVQMEWGQFDAERNALFLIGHGIASPEVASDVEAGHAHPGPGGVGIRRPRRQLGDDPASGPVTMGHFLSTPSGWRMLISRRNRWSIRAFLRRGPRPGASRDAGARVLGHHPGAAAWPIT